MKATIRVDTRRPIGSVRPGIFGGFIEHLGRVIYGGLYDPDSAVADENGWRTDVLASLRHLDLSIIRYPGGNFASGYHWEDGIGPRHERKQVLDEAWNTIEPNLIGTDEFLQVCRMMGWEPMLTVNLGTGTAGEAAAWVAHTNRNDSAVKYWCLGNEMDGDWQIGHAPAPEYAARALEAARAMRAVDPKIALVACGSSNPEMATFLEWDQTVLEALSGQADYISLHRYAGKHNDDSEDFLAITNDIDRQIEEVDEICRRVAERSGQNRAYLCFDEWNVWYRTAFKRFSDGKGTVAPPLIEEQYNLEDALVVAGFLNSFVRHADVVHIANLAQLVNSIAPLVTDGDDLLVQSIFWPFEMFSRRRHGVSLEHDVEAPTYASARYGEASFLDTSMIIDDDQLSLFMVNRSAGDLEVKVHPQDVSVSNTASAEILTAASLDAVNTRENRHAVATNAFDDVSVGRNDVTLMLPPYSFCTATVNVC